MAEKINSCAMCGGHLKRISGFWRCEKCGFVRHQKKFGHIGAGPDGFVEKEDDLYRIYKNTEPQKRINAGDPEPLDKIFKR